MEELLRQFGGGQCGGTTRNYGNGAWAYRNSNTGVGIRQVPLDQKET